MRHSARRRALVIAGSTVIAGFALVAPAYAATSGPSATTAVTGAPHTASGATLQPGGTIQHVVRPETALSGGKNASSTSTNWSGYAATGSHVTPASPRAGPNPPAPASQATSIRVSGSAWTATTAARWSRPVPTPIAPAGHRSITPGTRCTRRASVEINHTVRPGDKISASVTYAGSNKFTLKIADSTQNWTYSISKSLSGAAARRRRSSPKRRAVPTAAASSRWPTSAR